VSVQKINSDITDEMKQAHNKIYIFDLVCVITTTCGELNIEKVDGEDTYGFFIRTHSPSYTFVKIA